MPRFQTYFGISVPVFREEKIGAGSTTIRFVLRGRVVSKKNHQMAVVVKKNAKNYLHELNQGKGMITLQDALCAIDMVTAKMRGNSEYLKFVEEFKPVIHEQMKVWEDRLAHKGLVFPLKKASLSLRLFFKDRYITDTVNKQQTIQDLLIDAGAISNDDYKVLNPISSASACYYEELTENITFISLSFKMNNIKNTS